MVRMTVFCLFILISIFATSAISAEPPRYYAPKNSLPVMENVAPEKPVAVKVKKNKNRQSHSSGGHAVDINRASWEEIDDGLVGIGPSKAKAIVEFREKRGRFKSAADLLDVKGIGESILAKNKDWIQL